MAGYYLHSLDWGQLVELVDNPSTEMIAAFTDIFRTCLESIKGRLKKGYVMHKWPTTAAPLQDVVRSHFKKPNWYQDVTSHEGDAWESALCEFVRTDKRFDDKFHGDDHISWFAISQGIDHHRLIGTDAKELADFGTRPFHYARPDEPEMNWLWYPMHSMHTPEETSKIANQLRAAEESILNCGQLGAAVDYRVLSGMFDEIVPKKRALYVRVDT